MRARLLKKVAKERIALIVPAYEGRPLTPVERARLRRLDRIAARYRTAISGAR